MAYHHQWWTLFVTSFLQTLKLPCSTTAPSMVIFENSKLACDSQNEHCEGAALADIQWRLSNSVHHVKTQFTWGLLLFLQLCLYKESIMTTLYPCALCSHAFLPMIYCNSAHEHQN